MRLWTIQPWAAWLQLQETGRLPTDREYIDTFLLFAYDWLIAEMEKRIGPPPAGVEYPVWAWYQWENPARRKPDLRFFRYHSMPGKRVRLEIEIPDTAVVLSDYDLWTGVLYNSYLVASIEDQTAFADSLKETGLEDWAMSYPEPFQSQIVASWQRIFAPGWDTAHVVRVRKGQLIQATFWQLEMSQVKQVKIFEAVNRAGAYEVY